MEVILTADKTQTSNFRGQTYGGFYACLGNSYDNSLARHLIMPQTKRFMPIGLRKAESSLINSGIKAKSVHIDEIEKNITKETKFVCVSCVDPLGNGPTSGLFKIYNNEGSVLEKEFKYMMDKIKSLKAKHNFKVLAGGPGVQWLIGKEDYFGIDYLFFGEAEITLPKIIKNPPEKKIINAELPKEHEITAIKAPSCFGAVEITRGCGRGCSFCAPATSGKIRNVDLNQIIDEVKINVNAGYRKVSLRSEDFLLYKNKKLIPQTDEVMELMKSVYNIKGVSEVNPIHSSFASVLSNTELVDKLDGFFKSKGRKSFGFQPGIETGSERLIRKYMLGKKYPFKQDWSEIVKESLAVLEKKRWVTTSTMIFGLPGETEDDLIATENLIDEIKDYSTIIAPQIFVSYSNASMKDKKTEKIDYLRIKLINKCFRMDFKKAVKLNSSFSGKYNLRNITQNSIAEYSFPFLNKIINKKEEELRKAV
ncbi:MAG: radical SAM protein [Candidatus Nanoarchaeia archaeon]|nr:radical SAM protein [Candidatus Nanoarchaeia archaeon]